MTYKKYEQSTFTWSTGDELNFIRNIGSFSTVPMSKKELLRKYLKLCEVRTNWEFMSKDKCISCAKNALLNIRLGEDYEINNVQYEVQR